MSKKITAARAAAFLKAVGETGNQTLAAERARVSRSWVVLHRRRDAGFDAAVRAAVEEARERLAGAVREGNAALRQAQGERSGWRGNKPPAKWAYLDGVELVVRGTGDGIGGRRRVQVARARLKGWSGRTETRFLEALAGTCNVRAACAAVGLSAASAYNHRDRWPEFGRRWDETVTVASGRIEEGMLRAGINPFSSRNAPSDVPIEGMTADHALQLLRLHRCAPRPGRRTGRPPQRMSFEEACGALEKVLARHERQEARRAARKDSAG